jgi:entry exclusion lipoprotein TrbK
MTTSRPALLTLVSLVATLISACSPEPPKQEMPAVNDENCKPEKNRPGRGQRRARAVRLGVSASRPRIPTEPKERMVSSPMSMAAVW